MLYVELLGKRFHMCRSRGFRGRVPPTMELTTPSSLSSSAPTATGSGLVLLQSQPESGRVEGLSTSLWDTQLLPGPEVYAPLNPPRHTHTHTHPFSRNEDWQLSHIQEHSWSFQGEGNLGGHWDMLDRDVCSGQTDGQASARPTWTRHADTACGPPCNAQSGQVGTP